jgi:hypothetical protein
MEAALWSIVNRGEGETDRSLIERTHQRYKTESPNLKSFTISIKDKWTQIREEYRKWKQKNVTENTDSLKTFAQKRLRNLRKLNKDQA